MSTFEHLSGSYTGESFNGVPYGQGIWIVPDAAKYVGEWRDGGMYGKGTLTFHDGRKYVGKWEDTAKSWEGPEYQDGKIVATYSEGVAEAQ